ncbi:MAG: ABC transporter ATP-binding protein [Synechococcaceae cyanobacterium SM2_3_1]|nr:ABC transporter ATP-binding protein [Synechococcaceae cyanobacterium SM2_3_1]
MTTSPTQEPLPLLRVKHLHVHFQMRHRSDSSQKQGLVKAVNDLSLEVARGETLGLVGESGCGKSTTGRAILQLCKPTAGKVFLEDTDLTQLRGESRRQVRRRLQMIFQDPYASLNPRQTVASIVGEPLTIFGLAHGQEKREQVQHLLHMVGLPPEFGNRYPHEFSGGQRQRIVIARALSLQPEFIVCDEPVSALDVSIQAQILNLLQNLQSRLQLTYLFIAHDLSVVRHVSNRIAVMYLGKIVELADQEELYQHPLHPYTQALLSAAPIPDPLAESQRQRIILQGDIPNPLQIPQGCAFHPRCPYAMDSCRGDPEPQLLDAGGGHQVACHLIHSPTSSGISSTAARNP